MYSIVLHIEYAKLLCKTVYMSSVYRGKKTNIEDHIDIWKIKESCLQIKVDALAR